MPVIAPARKAMVRPPCSEVRAASAVRTFAFTETFMPTKPVTPERTAPITKPTAGDEAEETPTSTATITPTMAIVRYWRLR